MQTIEEKQLPSFDATLWEDNVRRNVSLRSCLLLIGHMARTEYFTAALSCVITSGIGVQLAEIAELIAAYLDER